MNDAEDFEEQELRGYVPGDGRPLRHPMTVTVMRVVIVIGIFALVVPPVYATFALQVHTANAVCARVVETFAPGSSAVARFEPMGAVGPSWYCYARSFDGHEVLVRSLGLIPG